MLKRCQICILLHGKDGLDPAPAVRFCAVPPQKFDKLRMTDSSAPLLAHCGGVTLGSLREGAVTVGD